MKFSRKYTLVLASLVCLSASVPVVSGMKRPAPGTIEKPGDAKKSKTVVTVLKPFNQRNPKVVQISHPIFQGHKNYVDAMPMDIKTHIAGYVFDKSKQMAHWKKGQKGYLVAMINDKPAHEVDNITPAEVGAKILASKDDDVVCDFFRLIGCIQDKKVRDDFLQALGLNSNTIFKTEAFALFTASTGDLERFKLLIDAKPQFLFNQYGKYQNLLHVAIVNRQLSIIRFFLTQYEIFFKDEKNATVMLVAAIATNDIKIVKIIMDAVSLKNQNYVESVLTAAIATNNAQIVKAVLSTLSLKDENNVRNVLKVAIATNNAEIVKIVLDVVRLKDKDNATSILCAGFKTDNIEIVKVLLSQTGYFSKLPADTSLCTFMALPQSLTLFEFVLQWGANSNVVHDWDKVRRLLPSEIDQLHSRPTELTPLMFCILCFEVMGNLDKTLQCIKLLIDYGADRDYKIKYAYYSIISVDDLITKRPLGNENRMAIKNFIKNYVAQPKEAWSAADCVMQ